MEGRRLKVMLGAAIVNPGFKEASGIAGSMVRQHFFERMRDSFTRYNLDIIARWHYNICQMSE